MLGACILHGSGVLTPRASGYALPSLLGDRCSMRCYQQQRQRSLSITSATEGQTKVKGKTQGGSKTQEDSLSFAEWTQEAGSTGLDGPHLNMHSVIASTLDRQWLAQKRPKEYVAGEAVHGTGPGPQAVAPEPASPGHEEAASASSPAGVALPSRAAASAASNGKASVAQKQSPSASCTLSAVWRPEAQVHSCLQR